MIRVLFCYLGTLMKKRIRWDVNCPIGFIYTSLTQAGLYYLVFPCLVYLGFLLFTSFICLLKSRGTKIIKTTKKMMGIKVIKSTVQFQSNSIFIYYLKAQLDLQT